MEIESSIGKSPASPAKRDFSKIYFYKAGQVVGESAANDDKMIADIRKKFPNALTETVPDEEAFQAAKQKYREEQAAHVERFCKYCFSESMVPDDEFTRHLLGKLMSDRNGFHEAFNAFLELAPSLVDIARRIYAK